MSSQGWATSSSLLTLLFLLPSASTICSRIHRVVLKSIALTHFQLQAAIIDLDGTLIDTLDDFVAALNLMVLELGLAEVPLTRAVVEPMVGKGAEHLVKSVLKHLAAGENTARTAIINIAISENAALAAAAHNAFQKHYKAINGRHSKIYSGVAEGLEGFRKVGLKLACVTNKPAAFAHTLLKLKSLDGYFSCVFGGDSFARKKPDPMPLIKTCEALITAPRHTLMIGDSVNDALAARAAGCPVALVTYGYNHGQPIRDVDADAFVDSMDELLTVLVPTQ